jgi:hypothetical protein
MAFPDVENVAGVTASANRYSMNCRPEACCVKPEPSPFDTMAAAGLGISRTQLYVRLRRYQLS